MQKASGGEGLTLQGTTEGDTRNGLIWESGVKAPTYTLLNSLYASPYGHDVCYRENNSPLSLSPLPKFPSTANMRPAETTPTATPRTPATHKQEERKVNNAFYRAICMHTHTPLTGEQYDDCYIQEMSMRSWLAVCIIVRVNFSIIGPMDSNLEHRLEA